MRLVDTAGIRRALDEAESIGIRKSAEALADADLVLVVLDSSQPMARDDEELLRQVRGRRAIVAENKSDRGRFDPAAQPFAQLPRVATSALTGEGLPALRAEILRQLGGEGGGSSEAGFLTTLRQRDLVSKSVAALASAEAAIPRLIPHEMLLLDLYDGLRPLDEITGTTTTEDILNLIFSTFCIGK